MSRGFIWNYNRSFAWFICNYGTGTIIAFHLQYGSRYFFNHYGRIVHWGDIWGVHSRYINQHPWHPISNRYNVRRVPLSAKREGCSCSCSSFAKFGSWGNFRRLSSVIFHPLISILRFEVWASWIFVGFFSWFGNDSYVIGRFFNKGCYRRLYWLGTRNYRYLSCWRRIKIYIWFFRFTGWFRIN